MQFENLTKNNIKLYSIKAYDNPNMLLSEYMADYKRFNYVKRLFNKYIKTNVIHERLILNHIIIIYNVFGIEHATRMLFYFLPDTQYPVLKTYLYFLNLMPEIVYGINNLNINLSHIEIDNNVLSILNNIYEKN
uniref:Uncharacterized protein n=1 Tax=viral metagenome TaxID=1070528 RepID=A0A6C0JVE1_9ZZZZ